MQYHKDFELEKNVYSVAVDCSVLYMSFSLSLLIVSLRVFISPRFLVCLIYSEKLVKILLFAGEFVHRFWGYVIKCIKFRIIIFSWWIEAFIIMHWRSLFLEMLFALKSILYNISMAPSDFFLSFLYQIYLCSIFPILWLSLPLCFRWGTYEEHRVGLFLL